MAKPSPALLERAAKDNLSTLDVIHRLCDEEKQSRLRSAVDRRLRDARFPEINTIDGFNFDFDPGAQEDPRSLPRSARPRLPRQGHQPALHRHARHGQDLPRPSARLPGLPGHPPRRLRLRSAHAQRPPRRRAPRRPRSRATPLRPRRAARHRRLRRPCHEDPAHQARLPGHLRALRLPPLDLHHQRPGGLRGESHEGLDPALRIVSSGGEPLLALARWLVQEVRAEDAPNGESWGRFACPAGGTRHRNVDAERQTQLSLSLSDRPPSGAPGGRR